MKVNIMSMPIRPNICGRSVLICAGSVLILYCIISLQVGGGDTHAGGGLICIYPNETTAGGNMSICVGSV